MDIYRKCYPCLSSKSMTPAWSPRIVYGQIANTKDVPFFVEVNVLYDATSFTCGGALLNSRTVLTAAHCVYGYDDQTPNEVGVFALHGTSQPTWSRSWTIASSYDSDLLYDDAALIHLDEPIMQTRYATVNANLSRTLRTSRRNLSVYGVGLTEFGSPSESLRKATLLSVPLAECSPVHWSSQTLGEDICAIGLCNEKDECQDSCSGDSGGPLLDDETGDLVGIVSRGTFPCGQLWPGIYANLNTQGVRSLLEKTLPPNPNPPPPLPSRVLSRAVRASLRLSWFLFVLTLMLT